MRPVNARVWVLISFFLAISLIVIQAYFDKFQDDQHRSAIVAEYERGTVARNSINQLNVAFAAQTTALKNLWLHGKDTTLYHRQLSHYYATQRAVRSHIDELISLLPDHESLHVLAQDISANHHQRRTQHRKAIKLFNATDEEAHARADRLLGDNEQIFANLLAAFDHEREDYQQKKILQLQSRIAENHFYNLLTIVVISVMVLVWLYLILDGKFRELSDSEIRQSTILRTLSDALVTVDENGLIEAFNPATESLFGYQGHELLGRKVDLLLPHDQPAVGKLSALCSLNINLEREGRHKDGGRFLLEVRAAPMALGQQKSCVLLMRDITSRNEAEKALVEALELNSGIIQQSPIGMTLYDLSGQCLEANNSVAEIIGATREQVLAQNFYQIESWRKSGLLEAAQNCLATQEIFRHEFDIVTSFGKRAFFDCQLIPLTVHHNQRLLFMIDDVSERKEAEIKLEQALAEKMTLLKEIHHRVKNNMQIISGLMYLQAQKSSNPETLDFLQDSQGRINSMGLIHEQLYNTENLAKISFKEYIETLIEALKLSYGSLTTGVAFQLETERIELPVDAAIPCGLIINELLTNSLKHAFCNNQPGVITVRFARDADICTLVVRDNGNGLPDDYDWSASETLGLSLVRTLAGQLEAEVEFQNNNGCECQLSFALAG